MIAAGSSQADVRDPHEAALPVDPRVDFIFVMPVCQNAFDSRAQPKTAERVEEEEKKKKEDEEEEKEEEEEEEEEEEDSRKCDDRPLEAS
ncbi:hypothetical protein SprV_0301313300 [Sparganum proliferum]